MSGRLIILPKKSYNPWKPENVERVLRDERLERERRAQLEEADQMKQSEDRVELLRTRRTRGRANDSDADSGRTDADADKDEAGKGTALEHVNLFADEEKAMMEEAVSGDGPVSEADKKKKAPAGIMPLYLGGEEAARRRGEKAVPFYLQPSASAQSKPLDGIEGTGLSSSIQPDESEALRVRRDERLKTHVDPMQDFCKVSNGQAPTIPAKEVIDRADNERQRKRHRRKRRESYYTSSSESDDSSCSSSSSEYEDSRRKKRRRRKRKHGKERDTRNGFKRKSSSREDKRRRKDKKRSSRQNTKNASAQSHTIAPSIDELRRRRRLREQKEAERSFMVRLEDQSLSGAAGHHHKFQDQYNPSLSRR